MKWCIVLLMTKIGQTHTPEALHMMCYQMLSPPPCSWCVWVCGSLCKAYHAKQIKGNQPRCCVTTQLRGQAGEGQEGADCRCALHFQSFFLTRCRLCGYLLPGRKEARQCCVSGSNDTQVQAPSGLSPETKGLATSPSSLAFSHSTSPSSVPARTPPWLQGGMKRHRI